jgi:hypothetical protein
MTSLTTNTYIIYLSLLGHYFMSRRTLRTAELKISSSLSTDKHCLFVCNAATATVPVKKNEICVK